jgi:hypothetical protein
MRGLVNTVVYTVIVFVDTNHRPALFKAHNVSEAGLCLRPLVKAYSAGPNR